MLPLHKIMNPETKGKLSSIKIILQPTVTVLAPEKYNAMHIQ